MKPPSSWPEHVREAVAERAALLEHDAELPRAEAERRALAEGRALYFEHEKQKLAGEWWRRP